MVPATLQCAGKSGTKTSHAEHRENQGESKTGDRDNDIADDDDDDDDGVDRGNSVVDTSESNKGEEDLLINWVD